MELLLHTTLDMVFNVTHYLELHNAMFFVIDVNIYQV